MACSPGILNDRILFSLPTAVQVQPPATAPFLLLRCVTVSDFFNEHLPGAQFCTRPWEQQWALQTPRGHSCWQCPKSVMRESGR